jgi:hypothetical protein
VQPVKVMVDGTQIGSLVSPASGSFAAFSIPFSVASSGTHTIMFAGTDPNDRTTFIDAVGVTAGSGASTTTMLASSANPSTVGANVTFTATVTGNAPTGSAAFTADGTTLSGCGAVALSGTGNSRTAQCSTSGLAVGTHSIVATYGGDGANSGSISAALAQVVNSTAPASLVNASFEIPFLGGGYQYRPTASGVAWTFANNSGIAANGSAFHPATAPDGVQCAFLQMTGAISQAITLAAGSYTLSFKAVARPQGQGPNPVAVTMDGVQIGAAVTPASSQTWAAYSIPFSVAADGTHTLAFVGQSPTTQDLTTFVDAVTIQ